MPLRQRCVRADLPHQDAWTLAPARQSRSLDNAQLGAREHARVGSGLTGIERDDVTGDQIAGIDLTEDAVAKDRRPVRFQPIERLDGAVGANLDGESRPFSASTAAMARASAMSCMAAATIAPATSSSTTTLLNCAASTPTTMRGLRGSAFGPTTARRARASDVDSSTRRAQRRERLVQDSSCQSVRGRLLMAESLAWSHRPTYSQGGYHALLIGSAGQRDRPVRCGEHFAAGQYSARGIAQSAAIVTLHSGGGGGVECAQTAGRMMWAHILMRDEAGLS